MNGSVPAPPLSLSASLAQSDAGRVTCSLRMDKGHKLPAVWAREVTRFGTTERRRGGWRPPPLRGRRVAGPCACGGRRQREAALGGAPARRGHTPSGSRVLGPGLPFLLRVPALLLQQRGRQDVLSRAGQQPQQPVCGLRLRHRDRGRQRGHPEQGEVPEDVLGQRRCEGGSAHGLLGSALPRRCWGPGPLML